MSFSFQLSSTSTATSSSSSFAPRLGRITFRNGTNLNTPNLITPTSRGVVPHLSSDNVLRAKPISWIHVPYESFLECRPPILTLGPTTHQLLGFKHDKHIISMSLRDLSDGREMPPNAAKYVSAWCVRGVRKVTPGEYRQYILKARPDLVYALADTQPAVSQKRLVKSVERTADWLVQLLKPSSPEEDPTVFPKVLLQMPGAQSSPARTAFARTIREPLHPTEIDVLRPLSLSCLDDAVSGYVVDGSVDLMKASLNGLDASKLRISHTSNFSTPSTSETSQLTGLDLIRGPHDILVLIRDVGVDLFGGEWAVKLAQWGVALDFEFPSPKVPSNSDESPSESGGSPKMRGNKCDIGHNLYDLRYRTDFARLLNSASSVTCSCFACNPSSCSPEDVIRHSSIDDPHSSNLKTPHPSHTRAYIHHLLHTHEMSAHAMLVAHNLGVLSAFFDGIRSVLITHPEDFDMEVARFLEHYDSGRGGRDYATKVAEEVEPVIEGIVEAHPDQAGSMPHHVGTQGLGILLYDEAETCHLQVEVLRGKGSLKRNRDTA